MEIQRKIRTMTSSVNDMGILGKAFLATTFAKFRVTMMPIPMTMITASNLAKKL
jgi:hypothetical protein